MEIPGKYHVLGSLGKSPDSHGSRYTSSRLIVGYCSISGQRRDKRIVLEIKDIDSFQVEKA